MRKSLLVLSISLGAFTAQSQVIFSEDFDGIGGPTAGGAGTYTFAPGWLLRNVDNATPAASVSYVNEAWERREDFSFNVADSAAFSTSWTTPVVAANDWMWTPSFTVQPNTVLRWNAVTYDAAYPDGYEVRIMTQSSTPGGPTGGSGVIGNQITNSTSIFSIAAENSSWTARSVSLNAYAGQTVWIAFRNNSTDKFLLLIDDVIAEVLLNNDLRVVSGSVSHGEYSVAPSNQLTTTQNIQLSGTIQNSGVQPATNAALACDVLLNGSFLTTVTSTTTASLASGASSVKTISYTPTADGAYDFRFYPVFTESDQMTSNDTVYDPVGIVVNSAMMRRDDGNVTGALGIGAGTIGYLGQTFNFEAPVTIESISAYMTRGYTGRTLRAVIYNTNGSGVPTTYYAGTDTLTYPDDSARLYTMPIHGGPITLPAGKYGILQVEIDSTLALANCMSIFRNNTVFVQWAANGPAFMPVESFGAGFARTFVLYPNFDVCTGQTGGTVAGTIPASCGGSDGSAEITLDAGYSIEWEDGSTNAINSSLPAGYAVYTLTSAYCTFTDSVEITNPNSPAGSISGTTEQLCDGTPGTATVSATGGTAPYTYAWSNGDNTATATAAAGTYSVVITDAASCMTTVSNIVIPVQQGPSANVQTNTSALCNGDNGTVVLNIQNGASPYTVDWSNGDSGATLNAPAGTYSAMITDANSCTTTLNNVIITEPSVITANESGTDETCDSCNDGTAEVAPAGGTAPYTVSWSNGATGDSIGGLAPGTYTATITDANGCSITQDVVVNSFVGIDELTSYGIVVYPNPVTDFLAIDATKGNVRSIALLDASGKLISLLTQNGKTFSLDMRHLANGVYHLTIETNNGRLVTSIAKQ